MGKLTGNHWVSMRSLMIIADKKYSGENRNDWD